MSKAELKKTAIGAIIGAILAQIICYLLFNGFAQTGYQIIVCFIVGIPCGYLGRKFL